MKTSVGLPLIVLLGSVAGVSAQPSAPGPNPIQPGYAVSPGPLGVGMPHHGMIAQPAWPVTPPAMPMPAQTRDTPYRAPVGPAAEASQTLKDGMDRLLGYLTQEEIPNKLQVAAFLDREIAAYFDFDYMARWVAGPAYERLSGADQQALAANLEADFLSTLASQLLRFKDQQIRLLPPRLDPRGAAHVPVAITRPGTYPSKLEFRMYKSETGWRIYDVVADGQSAAAYYRVQFRQFFAATGGQ
ncbi:MAG: ABC transporter substrate-binding protein [Sphingobacteriia bacterium]|nr:ABC transporter substrate-binding protein [Sphingobacteriia bacterium]NCC39328.1 ABC transporter substrate-binding protein [Gammaproteobacteria bacterium]